MINIAIIGASGRMGRMLIAQALLDDALNLVGAYTIENDPLIGIDAGVLIGQEPCGVALTTLNKAVAADVFVDFSLPSALDSVIDTCQKHQSALVMGVTGLNDANFAKLDALAKSVPVVYAGNYSTGVNLCLELLKTAANVLGIDCDAEIVETHHCHKKDAPSGTALMMAKAVADGRHQTMDLTHGRCGQSLRKKGQIGMHALRGGEIVGEHSVQFISDFETITISHSAKSRDVFAKGAMRAATWVVNQPAKRYDMQDVLGFSLTQ